MAKRAAYIPPSYDRAPREYDQAFVRIEMLTSSHGIFHPIGARLWPTSYGNPAVAFPLHFVTSTEREAEVVAALARNQAPPARPTTVPAYFVELDTEEERRQAEPVVAISGFGWKHYVEHPEDIAQLWGAAAYFGAPEPGIPLLAWSPDRFSILTASAG